MVERAKKNFSRCMALFGSSIKWGILLLILPNVPRNTQTGYPTLGWDSPSRVKTVVPTLGCNNCSHPRHFPALPSHATSCHPVSLFRFLLFCLALLSSHHCWIPWLSCAVWVSSAVRCDHISAGTLGWSNYAHPPPRLAVLSPHHCQTRRRSSLFLFMSCAVRVSTAVCCDRKSVGTLGWNYYSPLLKLSISAPPDLWVSPFLRL